LARRAFGKGGGLIVKKFLISKFYVKINLLKITFNFLKMLNKNKKSLKKSKIEKVFSGNQVMMMLESVNGGIEVVAESQKQLIQNQNELKDDLENFKVEIKSDLLDFKIETGDNFKKVFNRLDRIELEIKDIKKEIKLLDKNKIDRFEYKDLLKRVNRIEKKLEKQRKEQAKSLV
jgi:hypothetical protein